MPTSRKCGGLQIITSIIEEGGCDAKHFTLLFLSIQVCMEIYGYHKLPIITTDKDMEWVFNFKVSFRYTGSYDDLVEKVRMHVQ